MVVYADTSFLVSLYGQDANSPQAQRLASERQTPFAWTALQRHEARNALRLAVLRKDITAKECASVLAAMERDEKSGVLAAAPVSWAEVFERAEDLSAAYAKALGTRAADILHVAAAVALGVREFLTFDERQKALARKAGMMVHP